MAAFVSLASLASLSLYYKILTRFVNILPTQPLVILCVHAYEPVAVLQAAVGFRKTLELHAVPQHVAAIMRKILIGITQKSEI